MGISEMIELFNPGIEYYVEWIKREPFTLVRYGDGEWRVIADISLTTGQEATFANPADPGACEVLRNTVVNCHRGGRYLMASVNPKIIRTMGCARTFKLWLKRNVPRWVKWHHGAVWRNAVKAGQMFPMIRAIREQPLPVVLVGPATIASIGKALTVVQHIVTSETEAWYDRARIEHRILRFGRPAFYCFSVGSVAKVMIHDLWSTLGEDSYMIDFGAVWAGLCGHPIRHYQKKLTPKLIRRNLTGEGGAS